VISIRRLSIANHLATITPELASLIQLPIRLASIATLLVAVAACGQIDTMKEGFAHSQAVSAKLEKTLGLKSLVGFNWNNGSLTSVNVTFQGLPNNVALSDIAEKSKQVVVSEFKQTPKQIVIGFSIEP
jgi:hypothetical protein